MLSCFPFYGSLCLLPLCPTLSSLLPYLFYQQNYHLIPFHRHKPTDFHLSSDTLSSLGSLFFSKPLLNALLPYPRIYLHLQTPFPPNLFMHIYDLYILRLTSFSPLSTDRNRDELSCPLLLQFQTQVRSSEIPILAIRASAAWAANLLANTRHTSLSVLLFSRDTY